MKIALFMMLFLVAEMPTIETSTELPPARAPYPGAPSYTVYTDGLGNYYAKDSNGAVDYNGTDAGLILQSCISPGNSILVENGVFDTAYQVNVTNNLLLSFTNCNWTMANGAYVNFPSPGGVGGFFFGNLISNVNFKFVNSWLDCNIANQNPSSPAWIDGIGIQNSTQISIDGVQGTGFGGTVCHGSAVYLANCTDVTIGSITAYYCGNEAFSCRGCSYVTADAIDCYHVGKGPEHTGDAVGIWNAPGETTNDLTFNAIYADDGGAVLALFSDYGNTRNVNAGTVTGDNITYAGLLIGSHISGFNVSNIHVSSVVINNITATDPDFLGNGKAVEINTWFYGQTYDVSVDSVILQNSASVGVTLEGSVTNALQDIYIGSVIGKNIAYDGVGLYNCTRCTVGSIRLLNSETAGGNGVDLADTTYTTVTISSIIDTGSALNWGILETNESNTMISNYNTIIIQGLINASSFYGQYSLQGMNTTISGPGHVPIGPITNPVIKFALWMPVYYLGA
jgi:hypothetical protein